MYKLHVPEVPRDHQELRLIACFSRLSNSSWLSRLHLTQTPHTLFSFTTASSIPLKTSAFPFFVECIEVSANKNASSESASCLVWVVRYTSGRLMTNTRQRHPERAPVSVELPRHKHSITCTAFPYHHSNYLCAALRIEQCRTWTRPNGENDIVDTLLRHSSTGRVNCIFPNDTE